MNVTCHVISLCIITITFSVHEFGNIYCIQLFIRRNLGPLHASDTSPTQTNQTELSKNKTKRHNSISVLK